MKYIEVEGFINHQQKIREHELSDTKFDEISENYGDNLGAYFMVQEGYDYIVNWKIFGKPFIVRLSEIVAESNMNEKQQTNFIAMVGKLGKWLDKFNYQDRMDFCISLWSLFNDAYEEGSMDAIQIISKGLK